MQNTLPFFSIVIPTHNRSKQLSLCLQAIAQLDYPFDHFEVIVVDDESEISPELVVDSFRNRFDIKLIRQARAGVGIGRNRGSAQAIGDFLVFTDDDCEPAPDWLKTLAVGFHKSPECIIGGQTINALSDNMYSTASQLLISFLFDYYNTNSDQAIFLTGSNLAVPKHLFQTLCEFDPAFFLAGAEEREFCDRWRDNGYQMIYAPEVLVHHSHHLTFRSFIRQHLNYGRGAFYFHQARIRRGHSRLNVEPQSFYLNLLRYPFSKKYHLLAPFLSLLLLLSQVTNAIGYFKEKLFPLNKHRNSK